MLCAVLWRGPGGKDLRQQPREWSWKRTLPHSSPKRPEALANTSVIALRPWARGHSWAMPGFLSHRNCEIINVCCFKPWMFRVICYSAIDNYALSKIVTCHSHLDISCRSPPPHIFLLTTFPYKICVCVILTYIYLHILSVSPIRMWVLWRYVCLARTVPRTVLGTYLMLNKYLLNEGRGEKGGMRGIDHIWCSSHSWQLRGN